MNTIHHRGLPDDGVPKDHDMMNDLASEVVQEKPNDAAGTDYPVWEEPDPDDVLDQLIAAAPTVQDAPGAAE